MTAERQTITIKNGCAQQPSITIIKNTNQMRTMKEASFMHVLGKHVLLVCLSCLLAFTVRAQTTVTGTVSDTEGRPLAGVTVQVKGSTVASTTTVAGTFSIRAQGDATLVFTMVGFKPVERSVAGQSRINVTLESTAEEVEEVVVVGYNVVKRSDLTGSVTTVKSEEITAIPVNNPLQALQG